MKKVKVSGFIKIGDESFELGENLEGKPIMKDDKKIGEITRMYFEGGDLKFEGILETDNLPEVSYFIKKEEKKCIK